MFPSRKPVFVAAGAAIALGLASCGESRVAQCNKLIEVVNQGQTISQTVSGNDAATMQKLSADLNALSQDVAAVELQDAELQAFQTRFSEVYKKLSLASSDVASALAALDEIEPNPAGLERAQQLQASVDNASRVGDEAAQEEEALVEEVNTYCGGE